MRLHGGKFVGESLPTVKGKKNLHLVNSKKHRSFRSCHFMTVNCQIVTLTNKSSQNFLFKVSKQKKKKDYFYVCFMWL